MLTDKEVKFLRKELAESKNPLFLYDGDGDGLTSFLLLYKINREGKGIGLTNSRNLMDVGLRKVEELNPDKVFILDIPVVDQDFIDKLKRPCFWIDHHSPQKRDNVHYYNPRIKDPEAYIPTSRMCWQVSEKPEDLWIATAGSLADFAEPDFLEVFIQKHPTFLDKPYTLPTMLFKKKVGELVKLFFFLQKGSSSDVRKSVKVLSRIQVPEEVFQQTTPAGKLLFKHFSKVNKDYQVLLKEAKKKVNKTKLILFFYTENRNSFTTNLANELSGLYQSKYILIARRKGGQVKCSLRGKDVFIPLQMALKGVDGRGGGHHDACGAVVREEDWERFLENFNEALKNV